jgi:hypothetical protein
MIGTPTSAGNILQYRMQDYTLVKDGGVGGKRARRSNATCWTSSPMIRVPMTT